MDGSTSAMKPAGAGANPLALHGISLSLVNRSNGIIREIKGVST
jgi:hypothetical protein